MSKKRTALAGRPDIKAETILPAGEVDRRTLREWLSVRETWEYLVIRSAWRPRRVRQAANRLWPHLMLDWCPRRRAWLYSWPEMQAIAAYLDERPAR